MGMLIGISLGLLAWSDDVRADRNACGLNSMTLALAFLSGEPDQGELARRLPLDHAPFSLAELDAAARSLGYETFLARWHSVGEAEFGCPAILHIRANENSRSPDHFLACFGETAGGLCVAEFPRKPFILPRRRLERIWDGDVLSIDHPGRATISRLQREAFLSTAGLVVGVGLVAFLSSRLIYEAWYGRRIARSCQARAAAGRGRADGDPLPRDIFGDMGTHPPL